MATAARTNSAAAVPNRVQSTTTTSAPVYVYVAHAMNRARRLALKVPASNR